MEAEAYCIAMYCMCLSEILLPHITRTTKRDYQINLHTKSNFITVGGIRSTGLTASLGIGRHVVQCLLSSIVSPPPVEEDGEEELRQSIVRHPTPLPDVKELGKQYH